MKITNTQMQFEDMGKPEGLREKVARKIGAQLEKMAVDQNMCWAWGIYEPDVPIEIINEMAK